MLSADPKPNSDDCVNSVVVELLSLALEPISSSPPDVNRDEEEEEGLGVHPGDGGIKPIPLRVDAIAASHATVPGAATVAARHTAPVSWSVGCGFPMLKARTWMSGVSPSLAPCLAGAIAGGQTTAILGVPFVCAASSTERRETHPHGASAADRLNSIEVRGQVGVVENWYACAYACALCW